MKNILLVVLLALSLQGGEVACRESFKISMKHNSLVISATERKDLFARKKHIEQAIKWIDRTLAECHPDWYGRQTATELKEYLKTLKKDLVFY